MDIKTTVRAASLALLLLGWCGCPEAGDTNSGDDDDAGTGAGGAGGAGAGGADAGGAGGAGGADAGGPGDIETMCTVVCEVCFHGNAAWHQDTIENCIPECVADFDDCAPADIPTILECPGGPDCSAGMIGFGTCVAPYTCLL